MESITIAIDGPAASGKTTIGLLLAERTGFVMLDTGSMYRAVTLGVLNAGIDPADEAAVVAYAEQMRFAIASPEGHDDGRHYTVLLDDEDVTWDIRSEQVDRNVSTAAKWPGVRSAMVVQQRQIGRLGNIIMIGRDIGTVVLPDAPIKIFLTASAEERARRRVVDKRRQGILVDYESILADIRHRDEVDASRDVAPLKAAEDAILLDSTSQTPEQLVEQVLVLLDGTSPPESC